MSLEELRTILESTDFPVAFYQFPKEEPHDPPFICYITQETENFAADGKVYFSSQKVQVELYTPSKNLEAETKVEQALASFFYEKNEGNIENEKMYLVTYQFYI